MALGSNLNGLNFSYSFLAQKRRLEWQRFAVESIGFQGTSDDACQFCLWDCEIKPAVDINFNFKCDKKKKKKTENWPRHYGTRSYHWNTFITYKPRVFRRFLVERVLGKTTAPQHCGRPVPKPPEYITLHDTRDFADGIKVVDFEVGRWSHIIWGGAAILTAWVLKME